jgi:hypothetical protein
MSNKRRQYLDRRKRYRTRREAADYLTKRGIPVQPETLARWACTGRYCLPMIKLGKLVRYDDDDLDALILRCKVIPGEAA